MKYQQLSSEERYEIGFMRRQGWRVREMAEHLGRHRSTLYREVKRNRSVHDGSYRATHSVEKASGRKRRSRRNLRYGPEEFAPVETMIREGLSPEQVVGRRNLEGQRVMTVGSGPINGAAERCGETCAEPENNDESGMGAMTVAGGWLAKSA